MRKIGLYVLGLLVLSLLMLGVVLPVLADDGPIDVQVDHAGMDPRTGPIDPAFRTDGVFQSPQSRDVLDYNTAGNGPTTGNYFNIPGGGTGAGSGGSSDGKTSWWKDHGKGLLLGALEGIGIAVGVVAVGALFAIGSPIIAAAALGAVIGTAAYGAIAGASNYNPWEAAVNGLIGAVSGGIGAGLGAVSAGVKTLVIGAVDAVGSGIASAASYGLNTSSPTTEGYLSSFGVGAVIGGATYGLGRLASMTGIGQKVSGLLRGRTALELADDLHAVTPGMGDTVLDSVASEERVAAQTAVQTNPQVARRVLTTVGADEAETVGRKAITTLETEGTVTSSPGAWVTATESMSDRAAAYQTHVGGVSGKVYLVEGVKFDAFRDGKLIEAKGFYKQFVDVQTGKFKPWFSGSKAMVEQAKRQLRVADGTPVEWHFNEVETLAAARTAMQGKVSGIRFVLDEMPK